MFPGEPTLVGRGTNVVAFLCSVRPAAQYHDNATGLRNSRANINTPDLVGAYFDYPPTELLALVRTLRAGRLFCAPTRQSGQFGRLPCRTIAKVTRHRRRSLRRIRRRRPGTQVGPALVNLCHGIDYKWCDKRTAPDTAASASSFSSRISVLMVIGSVMFLVVIVLLLICLRNLVLNFACFLPNERFSNGTLWAICKMGRRSV